jgi:hypothetical protein
VTNCQMGRKLGWFSLYKIDCSRKKDGKIWKMDGRVDSDGLRRVEEGRRGERRKKSLGRRGCVRQGKGRLFSVVGRGAACGQSPIVGGGANPNFISSVDIVQYTSISSFVKLTLQYVGAGGGLCEEMRASAGWLRR